MDAHRDLINVCIVASGDWRAFTRVNCHEIAGRWREYGPVMYVEPAPLRTPALQDVGRIGRRLRDLLRKKRAVWPDNEGAVEVVAPLFLPWHPTSVVRRWNTEAASRAIERRLRDSHWTSGIDVLWFFGPALAGLERKVRARLVIYHAVDDYRANPDVRWALIEERERELVQGAHLVFAASTPLAERLRRIHPRVMVWENVSDTEGLIADTERHPARVRDDHQPTAVYVGNLSDHKVDFTLVLGVVRRMRHWSFVLGGPIGRIGPVGRQVLGEPNVRYVGPIPRESLAVVLSGADVALLPLPASALHDSSLPMKLLDYLAIGLPVVGRRTVPMGSVGELVQHAVTAEEYELRLASACALRHDREYRARALQLARHRSWTHRMVDLERTIRDTLARTRSPG